MISDQVMLISNGPRAKVGVVKYTCAGTSRADPQDVSVRNRPSGGGEVPSYPEMGGV